MKMVFMGTPEFAEISLKAVVDNGHDVALVLTQPDRKKNRGKQVTVSPVKEFAEKRGLRVLQPDRLKGNDEIVTVIENEKPDVIVVAAYGQILPEEVLRIPTLGAINVHGSLLPKFRGASPVQAAILSGDAETGVTIMRMSKGLDAGDMLLKKAVAIDKKTAGELEKELAAVGANLIIEALEGLRLGTLKGEPQDHAKATFCSLIKKQDGKIDFAKSAYDIERQIRAYDPWPGSFTGYLGRQLKFWKGEAMGISLKHEAKPGEIIAVEKNYFDVACGEGVLRVLSLQAPSKRRMDTDEFLRGNKLDVGRVFGED